MSYTPLHQHTIQDNVTGGHFHHPVAGGEYHLPPGYIEPDRGAADIRTGLSATPDVITPESWVTDNRLKLGASEILSRGRQAERVRARLARNQYTKTKAEDEFKRLGVRGLPLFAGLSYFKCVLPYNTGESCALIRVFGH